MKINMNKTKRTEFLKTSDVDVWFKAANKEKEISAKFEHDM